MDGLEFSENGSFSQDFPFFQKTFGEVRKYQKKLASKKKKDLNLYTHKYDNLINTSLRKNETSKFTYELTTSIIDVIKDSPSLPPLLAYRGIDPWMELEIGTRFSDLGFSSKSYDAVIASTFIHYQCCMLVLGYTQPSHQLFMEDFSDYPNEKELLTFPGEQFEVVEIGKGRNEMGDVINAYYCRYIGNIYNNGFDIKVNPQIDEDFDNYIIPVFRKISKTNILCMRGQNIIANFGFSDYFGIERPTIQSIQIIFHTQVIEKVYFIRLPNKEDIEGSYYTFNNGGIITTKEADDSGFFINDLLDEKIVVWTRYGIILEIPKATIIWEKK
jgi:hypothetical protein